MLLPAFELDFDQIELLGCTVADVLADPARFIGATLADPNEGREYGRGKGMVMQRADGTLWIYSFAHGRTTYDLEYDAAGLRAVLAALPDDQVIPQFVRLTRRMAEIDGMTKIRIRHELQKRLKEQLDIGKLEFRAEEKAALEDEDAEDARRRAEERQRRRVAAGDTRPQHPAPPDNTPYLEVIAQLDDVLVADRDDASGRGGEPVMRDIEGTLAAALIRQVDGMHLLTADTANASPATELPPPEHVLLTKLTTVEAAMTIERHIDYITPKEGNSVRLPTVFVNAYRQQRFDSPLPIVTSVATMPIVLPDGTLLFGHHLDRGRRILFRVPDGLEQLLPRPEHCDADAIAEAMHFLCDEWLVDVPCSYTDKLKLIALAMTILERAILPARPGFFITAGRRSTGKTTTLMMLAWAALGEMVSASAWSNVEEERRKALLAYMGAGVPLIAWDNIRRGSAITCPHIDRALTSHTYVDRVLGVTENRTVPAFSIHAWTGNNIGPKGDTSSRSLISRLDASRPDPENRSFTHADPIAWTHANRGRILRAIYTIILGNPRLIGADTSPRQTRFKVWHHLIGAALEHAAIWHRDRFAEHDPDCPPVAIAFKDQFLRNDDSDEHDYALAIVLRRLRGKWPGQKFTAAQLASWIGDSYDPLAYAFSKEFLPALDAATDMAPPFNNQYSPLALSLRLRSIHDAPTKVNSTILCLRYDADPHGGAYRVEELRP